MITTDSMIKEIRDIWSLIYPQPLDELNAILSEWGKDTWQVFNGIKPTEVDISSSEFLACTPLFDLPPKTAAAYLGTYILSFLIGLKFQEENFFFYDIITRSHVIHCLSEPSFWTAVIRPHIPIEGQEALVDLCSYIASRRELLALSREQTDLIENLAQNNFS